jgi:hypothetical protein
MKRVLLISGFVLVTLAGAWFGYALTAFLKQPFLAMIDISDLWILNLVALICLGLGLLLLVANSSGTRRAAWTQIAAGILISGLSVLGVFGLQYLHAEKTAPLGFTNERKPNAAKTVLGYHYLTPLFGGQAAMGDGSVIYLTKEEFATAPKANTPDEQPVWTSPVKSLEGAQELQQQAGEDAATFKVRQAKARMDISNELKLLARGHFFQLPGNKREVPCKPEELGNYPGLSKELKASLADGTYVWFFGWKPFVSQQKLRESAEWYRFGSWACWFGVATGIGATLGGWIVSRRKAGSLQAITDQ